MGVPEAGSRLTSAADVGGSHPRHVGFLHLSWDPWPSMQADAALRAVSALPERDVDAYADIDGRIAWRVRPGWRLSLAVGNLSRDRLEWGTSSSILLATAEAPSVRLSVSCDL